MQITHGSKPSFGRRLVAREAWIGPASGFVCALLVSLIGRATGFEYRSEVSMALFFIVMVFVGSYYNGRLKARPLTVVTVAIVSAAVSAAIAHY
jgi:hypothetical protein